MSKVLLEWTVGIQEAIDNAYLTAHNTLIALLEAHEAESNDTLSSLLKSLKDHEDANNRDFLDRSNSLNLHAAADEALFRAYTARAQKCLKDISAEYGKGVTYFNGLLATHEAAANPHNQYLLISDIGNRTGPDTDARVPPLVGSLIPYGYLPSDIILLDTLRMTYSGTTISQWSVVSDADRVQVARALSKDTDTLFVDRNTGFAYCLIGKDHVLMPLRIAVDQSLGDGTSFNAVANKTVSIALRNLQPISASLSTFSGGVKKWDGLVTIGEDGSYTPVKFVAGFGVSVKETSSTIAFSINESTTNRARDSVITTSHPGSLNIAARADHTHKMIGHTHQWGDITGTGEGVRHTLVRASEGVGSLSYTPNSSGTLENTLVSLYGKASALLGNVIPLKGSFQALDSEFSDLSGKYDNLYTKLGGATPFTPERVLITSSLGHIVSSSTVNTLHLGFARGLVANVAGQLNAKVSKANFVRVPSPDTVWSCPPVASWIEYSGGGVELGNPFDPKHRFFCLTDIKNAENNRMYRVTRSKPGGIVLQCDGGPGPYTKSHWYISGYQHSDNETSLVDHSSILFVKTVNELGEYVIFVKIC